MANSNNVGQWTVDRAASELKVSPITVMRWLKNGKVPGAKIGRRWLIPAEEIRRMLESKLNPARTTPQTAPETHEQKLELTLEPPLMYHWLEPLSPKEASEIALEVGTVLRTGGAPVNIDKLQPLIRGDDVPEPMFWRYLASGIRNLKARADGVEPSRCLEDQELLRMIRKAAGQQGQREENPPDDPGDPASSEVSAGANRTK